jgi:hypothetical protein
MRGVERNMSSSATEEALTDPDSHWRSHHTWNSMSSFEHDNSDGLNHGYPRSEQELVRDEPGRVAEIKQRIGKVVALANSPRLQDSDYVAHS